MFNTSTKFNNKKILRTSHYPSTFFFLFLREVSFCINVFHKLHRRCCKRLTKRCRLRLKSHRVSLFILTSISLTTLVGCYVRHAYNCKPTHSASSVFFQNLHKDAIKSHTPACYTLLDLASLSTTVSWLCCHGARCFTVMVIQNMLNHPPVASVNACCIGFDVLLTRYV